MSPEKDYKNIFSFNSSAYFDEGVAYDEFLVSGVVFEPYVLEAVTFGRMELIDFFSRVARSGGKILESLDTSPASQDSDYYLLSEWQNLIGQKVVLKDARLFTGKDSFIIIDDEFSQKVDLVGEFKGFSIQNYFNDNEVAAGFNADKSAEKLSLYVRLENPSIINNGQENAAESSIGRRLALPVYVSLSNGTPEVYRTVRIN